MPQKVDATFSFPTSFASPKSAILTTGADVTAAARPPGEFPAKFAEEFAAPSVDADAGSPPLGAALGEFLGEFGEFGEFRLGSSRIFSGLRSRCTIEASCRYCSNEWIVMNSDD